MKTAVFAGVVIFCVTCGLVLLGQIGQQKNIDKESLVTLAQTAQAQAAQETPAAAEQSAPAGTASASVQYPQLAARNAEEQTVTLGAIYDRIERTGEADKFKFRVDLTSRGAAVERVTLSEFRASSEFGTGEALTGDETTGPTKPGHLTLLAPITNGRTIYSLANTSLLVAPAEAPFGARAFPLDRLNWELVETNERDMARFEALLYEEGDASQETVRLSKTYRVEPGSYELLTDIAVENLSGQPLKVQMHIQGPGGILQEDLRQDTRHVMAAYMNADVRTRSLTFADVQSASREQVYPSRGIGAMFRNLFGSKESPAQKLQMLPPAADSDFIWAAVTNKYFAAIVRQVTDVPADGILQFGAAGFYSPVGPQADEQAAGKVSFVLQTSRQEPIVLAPGATQQLTLGSYLGPKDREVFEENPVYRALQYIQTISFQSCCCPTFFIAPLAFGIIWLMKSLYTLMGPWGNYGVVIMFLVFIVRLALHPITKKSQVSMMKMQKLGPKMQEIQKKYANNRAEMNKQMMQLYKEGGATPVMGMLPMFLQMPIWIALWTAVYTSIDLRGAGFLPFWITDLSVPDHLFRIPFAGTLQQIPLLGAIVPEYFNLLPILMGFVMYLQQKLMPMSQGAATNPQMAQQQKMMLIMMPLLFPVMLYNGPSGVNLYIMSSIGAGVIEQKVIRKHIAERQAEEEKGKVPTTAKLGGKVKKKKPKPFFKMK
jgi:YidC/Oxa1 family membrane protein insertase